MAAKSKSIDTRIKHFFAAFFALFLLAGLGIFVWASQNQTNTASNASAKYPCARDPKIEMYMKPKGNETSVYYYLKMTNRDSHDSSKRDACIPDTYRFKVKTPDGWKSTAISSDRTGGITLKEGESGTIFLKVERPTTETPGDYYITFGAYNLRHDDNTNDATIKLKYTVE